MYSQGNKLLTCNPDLISSLIALVLSSMHDFELYELLCQQYG